MYKVQQNAEGRLRIVEADGTTTPLVYATLEDLQADKEWRSRIEFRPSEFKEGAQYAVLMPSAYVDVEV